MRSQHESPAGEVKHSSDTSILPAALLGELDTNNTTLFIGALSSSVTEEDLRSFFGRFGDIVYTKIPAGKGCGFVQYVNRASAEYAMQQMQGQVDYRLRPAIHQPSNLMSLPNCLCQILCDHGSLAINEAGCKLFYQYAAWKAAGRNKVLAMIAPSLFAGQGPERQVTDYQGCCHDQCQCCADHRHISHSHFLGQEQRVSSPCKP